MKRGVSRFERRIVVAILLTGLAPFLVWMAVGFQLLVEAPLALPRQAKEQYESARLFYKEFIKAKKNEFSARADALAHDVVLTDAIERGALDDARLRLEALVADYDGIRRIQVIDPSGSPLVAVEGPAERMSEDFADRTYKVPLGLGEAPELRIVFLLPADYKTRREELQAFYESLQLALSSAADQQRNSLLRFALITTAVLFVALLTGFMIARRVTKRIARMASATERVAQGELDIQIPLSGDDEITELTAAFNKMVAEVASARDRIVYLEKVSGWQDLARRLAHEIKNPLTPIQLAAQELVRRLPPDASPEFRRLVNDAGDVVTEEIGALTRLVDEFSQFARLPEVSPETVELAAFVEEFLDAYNRFEGEADVEVDLPLHPVLVPLDRVLMRRVLANLATNAIQATAPGRARLRFSARLVEAERVVELRVEDNGPGVPPENASRIFEPYFTTKSEGTGLGLAIVKKIVLQHRGSIALAAAPGGGASFVRRLPLPTAAA